MKDIKVESTFYQGKRLETVVCNIFKVKSVQLSDLFGGQLNSDFIRKNLFIAISILSGAAYINANDEVKQEINEFFDKNSFNVGKSVSEIGIEESDKIIEEFIKIIKSVSSK